MPPKTKQETTDNFEYNFINFDIKFKFEVRVEIDEENNNDINNFIIIFEFLDNDSISYKKYLIQNMLEYVIDNKEVDNNKIFMVDISHKINSILLNEEKLKLISENNIKICIYNIISKQYILNIPINISEIILTKITNDMKEKLIIEKDKLLEINNDQLKQKEKNKKEKDIAIDYYDFFEYNKENCNNNIAYLNFKINCDKELLTEYTKFRLNPLLININKLEKILLDEFDNPFRNNLQFTDIYFKLLFLDKYYTTNLINRLKDFKVKENIVIFLGLEDQNNLVEYINNNHIIIEIHSRDYLKIKKEIKETNLTVFDITKLEIIKKEPENLKKDQKVNDKTKIEKQIPVTKKKDIKNNKIDFNINDFIFQDNYTISDNILYISKFKIFELNNPYTNVIRLKKILLPFIYLSSNNDNELNLNNLAKFEDVKELNNLDTLKHKSTIFCNFYLEYPINSFDISNINEYKNIKNYDQFKRYKHNYNFMFERIIFIIKYYDNIMLDKITKIFNDINKRYLNTDNIRDLRIQKIKDIQEEEGPFDFVTGCEIIDKDYRCFFIEGLSDKSIKEFYVEIPKTVVNSDNLKIIRNNNIKFNKRIYSKFNFQLKKIKLRESINSLAKKSDIYDRKKIQLNLFRTINNLFNIRLNNDLIYINNKNLFSTSKDFIELEIYFGDSIKKEDDTGIKNIKRKNKTKKNIKNNSFAFVKTEITQFNELIKDTSNIINKNNIETLIKQNNKHTIFKKYESIHESTKLENNLKNIKSSSTEKSYHNIKKHEVYNLHLKKIKNSNENVIIGGGKKLNYYDNVLYNELRDKVKDDKKYFYTWSKDYLSLSVDPYIVEEVLKKEDIINKSKFITNDGFQKILKRTKKEQLETKQINYIKELNQDYNYTKKDNIYDKNKKGFNLNTTVFNKEFSSIKKDTEFNFEIKTVKRDSLKLKNNIKINKKAGAYNIDKYKGLLADKAIKKGLILPKKYTKNKNIIINKEINNKPEFYNTEDIIKIDDNIKTVKKDVDFIRYLPNIFTKNYVYKNYK